MLCPMCNADTSVIDSRSSGMERIRRRRKCDVCDHRFTTYEVREHEVARADALDAAAADIAATALRLGELAARVMRPAERPSPPIVKAALSVMRKRHGIPSQRKAAERFGLEYTTYYRAETYGRYSPGVLGKVAAGYGLSLRELLAAAATVTQETA